MDCFINGLTSIERPKPTMLGLASIRYVKNGKPRIQIFRDIAEAYHFYTLINCTFLQQQSAKTNIFKHKGR